MSTPQITITRADVQLGIYDCGGRLVQALLEGTDWRRYDSIPGRIDFLHPIDIPDGGYVACWEAGNGVRWSIGPVAAQLAERHGEDGAS